MNFDVGRRAGLSQKIFIVLCYKRNARVSRTVTKIVHIVSIWLNTKLSVFGKYFFINDIDLFCIHTSFTNKSTLYINREYFWEPFEVCRSSRSRIIKIWLVCESDSGRIKWRHAQTCALSRIYAIQLIISRERIVFLCFQIIYINYLTMNMIFLKKSYLSR